MKIQSLIENKHTIKFSPYLKEVLAKMASYVNANLYQVDWNHGGWYHSYKWTSDQESEFEKWMNKK